MMVWQDDPWSYIPLISSMHSTILFSFLLLVISALAQRQFIRRMRAKRKDRDTGLHVLGPEPEDVNVE